MNNTHWLIGEGVGSSDETRFRLVVTVGINTGQNEEDS